MGLALAVGQEEELASTPDDQYNNTCLLKVWVERTKMAG